MNALARSFLLLYVPVLHQGYLDLFERYRYRVETCYVFANDIVKEADPMTNEIRAMDPKAAVRAIRGLGMFPHVDLLNRQSLRFLQRVKGSNLVVIDDEMSRRVVELYLSESMVTKESVFLRWDKDSVLSQGKIRSALVSIDPIDRALMDLSEAEAELTSCWWRQVGAIVTEAGSEYKQALLKAHNRHVPSEHTPYAVGDPRNVIPAGTRSELASSLHAEQGIIVRAASEGIPLKGKHLYVTVFPCPVCAKMVAYSGIRKLFFRTGHASLDGESVLKCQGVELIRVT